MNNTIFSKIDREKVVAFYHDWSMLAAEFDAPLSKVLKILPSDKLKPIQTSPDVTRIKLMGMEYRQIDGLAPYNEFGVLVPVERIDNDDKQDIPIYYIFQLPVTTQEACNGGVMYYGYPKFVAQINFDQDAETMKCRVSADGKDIISLEGQSLPTTFQTMDFCTYSVKNNKLLKTLIQVEGQSGMSTNPTNIQAPKYFLGNHPVAAEIMTLEMSENPVNYQYAPKLQSVLHFPIEVMSP